MLLWKLVDPEQAFETLKRNDLWCATHLHLRLLRPHFPHLDEYMTPPSSLQAVPLFLSTPLHVFHVEPWRRGLESEQIERHNPAVGHRMENR